SVSRFRGTAAIVVPTEDEHLILLDVHEIEQMRRMGRQNDLGGVVSVNTLRDFAQQPNNVLKAFGMDAVLGLLNEDEFRRRWMIS
ncbi:unnamed protein product, partial [marine sediment metagenome]